HKMGHGGKDIDDGRPLFPKMGIGILLIGHDPYAALPGSMPPMALAVLLTSSMIGGDQQQPILPMGGLTCLYGLPYFSNQAVLKVYGGPEAFAVPEPMAHIICKLEVDPGNVRRLFQNGLSCPIGDCIVDELHKVPLRVLWKVDGIVFQTVKGIVHFQIPGLL